MICTHPSTEFFDLKQNAHMKIWNFYSGFIFLIRKTLAIWKRLDRKLKTF